MRKVYIILINIVIFNNSFGQGKFDSLYLGQLPPGNIPKVFNLAVNSGCFAAERIAISSDGKEIYYSELKDLNWDQYCVKYYSYSNGHWNEPYVLFENYMAPALSTKGNQLYIESYSKNKSSYYSMRKDAN